MGSRQAILEVLKATKTVAADQTLAAALVRSEGQTARAIVETLLARQTKEGLKGLVAGWHRMDEATREIVLGRSDLIFGALREAFSSNDEQIRLNVIEIIQRGRFCRAAYLLDSALRDRVPGVRSAAAEAVHTLTDHVVQAAPAHALDPDVETGPDELRRYMVELEHYQEDRRQLAAAVDAALSSYELHQNVGVIKAAMWLVDDMGARLWKVLLVPGSRLTRAAQGLVGHGRDPRLIPFMLHALGYAEFRPIVAQMLASTSDPAFLEALFQESWRLVQMKTARALTTIRELSCTGNQLLDVVCLPKDAQRHFARCVLASGLETDVKIEVLKEMYRRGDPVGRRAALWALTGLEDSQSTIVLRSIAASGDTDFALIARRELVRRRPDEYPLEGLAPGGKPAPESKPNTPERMTAAAYWLAYDRLSEANRLRLGKELMADGRLTREAINGWLNSLEPSDQVRAVRVVSSLGLATEFEESIYQLCHDSHADVRSAAVAALGKIPTATSRRVLRTTLYDPDPRVQANTVEALEQVAGASSTADLVPKLASSDNRTRANAVRALLKLGVREAAATLLLMLRDENRAHRASALWLVDQMKLLPLAARVMEMAETDGDEQIRSRATALAKRIAAGEPEPALATAAQESGVPS